MAGENLPKVERSVDLDLGPDELWEHIVNGELASLWMGGTMTIETKIGGKVRLDHHGVRVFGTVETFEPGHRIGWTWRTSEGEPTMVTLQIEAAEGGTRLIVVEEMIPYEIVFIPPMVS